MPKSMVFLAVFIVFSVLIISTRGLIFEPPEPYGLGFIHVSKDPNYAFTNTVVSYDTDKLIIESTLETNYINHTPDNSYFGLSAGVDLSGKARIYVWNGTDWIDKTSLIEHISEKAMHGKTYEHIYYYSFGILPNSWSMTLRLEVDATKQQIRNYIKSENNLIVYFGEATSVLKITAGATDTIISNKYKAGLYSAGAWITACQSNLHQVEWPFEGDGWGTLYQGSLAAANRQVGRSVEDCVVNRDEITDLKIIKEETGCGPNDYKRTLNFLPNYFYHNDSTATTDSLLLMEHTTGVPELSAIINTSGISQHSGGSSFTDVTQYWSAYYDNGNGEVVCFTWKNDSKANNTNSIWRNGITTIYIGSWNTTPRADWNELITRYYFYDNASSDYWDECQAFWDRTQDSITLTETKGTSYEIDKGLEYGITSDSSDEIDVKITNANSNQTHVLLTLDFTKNVSNISIYNSTTTIVKATDNLNNFSILERGGNFSYVETASANSEEANISTCVVSNITGTTRCYVYLPFSSDIYLIAEPIVPTPLGVAISFIAPTLSNNSYIADDYIEVNTSVNENASSCLLEWDDGSASNETMTVTNANTNTNCWLNNTGLNDGEYLFIAYVNAVSGLAATGQRNITVDLVAPTMNITSPTAIETSTQIELNYSANDTNIDSCWYSEDGGTNTTLSDCGNITLSITSAGSHTIGVYVNDSAGTIAGDSIAFTLVIFNLVVYNATDNATITDWHIYMLNGSATNKTSFTNNNTFTLNISDVPGGEVETTIWKSGYGNNTFNFTNNKNVAFSFVRHLIEDTFFVNVVPANNSVFFSGDLFIMNISLPIYADGNASIWYNLNGSAYILGCSECTEYSRSISFTSGENNITALINSSTNYPGVDNEAKTIMISIYTAKYNISFFDEMTNKSIDFTTKNGTFRVFCVNTTLPDQQITGTLHEFIINCTGTLNYLWFKLYDPKGNHYRTLMPSSNIDNITFYMINTTPNDINVNLVTFVVTDASFKYQNGFMYFKKIILSEGQKDIIDTSIGTDGKVYANLIGGETYSLSVKSLDGTNSKSLGEYTVPDTTATTQPMTIIDVRFIPTTYNYIGTDISWEMQFNTTMGRIYFYWNDSTELTNSIQFWIYNITNVTARTQMHYDSVTGQSHHLFQWDYVTNGNENDTYLGYFEVDHETHGNITESRPLAKGGIFFQWLGNIGAWYHIFSVFIIVFVASIFGAKSAPIGAVILAIIAGFLFYIEWLPSIMAGAVRLTDLLMLTLIALAILAMFIIKRRRV